MRGLVGLFWTFERFQFVAPVTVFTGKNTGQQQMAGIQIWETEERVGL